MRKRAYASLIGLLSLVVVLPAQATQWRFNGPGNFSSGQWTALTTPPSVVTASAARLTPSPASPSTV